jgi:hypothetical protein
MKKVRSFSLKGEFEKAVRASDLPESERHRHNFKCLDPDCGASFHLVKGHRRKENTEVVEPTFARNPGSRHRDGCRFDFDAIAHQHRYQTFVRDDKLFLRINFPLGGMASDRHPDYPGLLSGAQKRAADQNTDKKPVASLQALARFLEKEFGTLQSDALEDLVLDYQGRPYPWAEAFTDADAYDRLYREGMKPEGQRNGLLVAVRPVQAAGFNANGKPKFLCEPHDVIINGLDEAIRPIIVCENDEIAREITLGQPLLIATRPHLSAFAQARELVPNDRIGVTLYVHDRSQIAAVPDSVLHKPLLAPAGLQSQLSLFDGLKP